MTTQVVLLTITILIMNSDRKVYARINVSSSGDTTLVSAPDAGAHIEIDHINILPSGGANVVSLKDGASTTIVDYALDDNQLVALDLPKGNPMELSAATAFIINLGSATKVTGFVAYRIVGEA